MKLFFIFFAACAVGETATTPACKSDADCRIEADYCKACDCRALAPGEKTPPCDGPGVRCAVDPCRGKVARCQTGVCVAGGTTER